MTTLFAPIVDAGHVPYCGPTAIAALTGVPVSRIEKMIRRCRRGGYRDSAGRKIAIKGSYPWEVIKVLKRLGCKVTAMKDPESTFGRFCADTAHINAAFLVRVTGHFMAAFKGTFCDTSNLEPVPVDGYNKAARRVIQAWRVEAPSSPMYTIDDPIMTPARPAKPKPAIREVRAARVAERIKAWEAKRKRADTALRKLRRQARYYGLAA